MEETKLIKHSIGRPTKYNSTMIVKAVEYIKSCSREATELPTIEGLALYLGVDDERIGEYAAKYPDFNATVKNLKYKQKNQLINDGMYGGKDVNASMAIFLLKANHQMSDGSNTFGMEFKSGEKSIKIFVTRGNATTA